MNLTQLLVSMYEEGDLKIEDGIPCYNATALTELQEFWHFNIPGMFDINKIEQTAAYEILRRHHEALKADKSWLENLSQPNMRAH